jgi:hypothetical protein
MGNCSSTSNCNPCGPDFSAINQLATKAGAYARQANTYATNAENSWLEFNALYLGAFAVAPTVDNEGEPLQVGALYWNTGSNTMFAWNGTTWVENGNFDEFTNFPLTYTTPIAATDLRAGQEYEINFVGTTNWTAIGAASATVGVRFIKNATVATGTGTAKIARDLNTRFADFVNVKDFGAVGNYTSDDTNAIKAALAFLPAAGGTIYFPAGLYRTTSTITIDKDNVSITGDGAGQGATSIGNWTLNNVPVGVPRGATQIIGDFVAGPVIRIKEDGARISNLSIDSSSNAVGGHAPISTGALGRKGSTDVTSHGILIMPDDLPGVSTARFCIDNILVNNQPADGIQCIDNIVSSRMDFTTVNCCNRHAINIQSGNYLGRTNVTKPGQVQLNNCRTTRCGGHGLLVGRPNEVSGVDAPYRIEINNLETFYNLIVPALAVNPANPSNAFLSGENHIMIDSAADGRTNFSGVVAAAYISLAIQGRLINIINYRAIDVVPYGIYVGESPSLATRGITIDNYYQNQTVAPVSNPAIFIQNTNVKQVTAISPYSTTAFTNLTNKLIGSGYYESYNGVVNSDVEQNHQEINAPEINADVFRSTITPFEVQIQDDEAFYIEFNQLARGMVVVSSQSPLRKSGIFHFRCGDGSALAEAIASSSTNVAVTTGPLTGTTGVDGDLTFSVNLALNRIYLENRTAGNGAYTFTFIGLNTNVKINSYAII